MSRSIGVIRRRSAYIEWKIENYSSYTEKNVCLKSPIFFSKHSFWYFSVYPKGDEFIKGAEDSVVFYLFKLISDSDCHAAVKVGILKNDGSEFNVQKAYNTFRGKRKQLQFEVCRVSDMTSKDITNNDAVKFFCSITLIDISAKFERPLTKNLETMIKDFKSAYINGRLSDVTISVKGQDFRAHKIVLAAMSPVFRDMFAKDMALGNGNRVNIPDCDPGSFNEFLLFLYAAELDFLPSKAFSLYETASKFNVKMLKQVCADLMMESDLDIDTSIRAAIIGTKYNESGLVSHACNYFFKNKEEILRSDKWQSFIDEYPTVAAELFQNVKDMLAEQG